MNCKERDSLTVHQKFVRGFVMETNWNMGEVEQDWMALCVFHGYMYYLSSGIRYQCYLGLKASTPTSSECRQNKYISISFCAKPPSFS